MFKSQAELNRKTGPHGIGRFDYLQQLVTEFQDTVSVDAKLQVLANLANFAYDPINYEYLRRLNVVELFLDELSETNENLVEYAIGGICNLTADAQNNVYIARNNGIKLISNCLFSSNENTVISAITALIYLSAAGYKNDAAAPPTINCMLKLKNSTNRRISNLAQVFIEDCCTGIPETFAHSYVP